MSLINKVSLMLSLVLVEISYCNIWDNIFSNLQNPLANIPEEFRLELFNGNSDYLEKSADLWVSVLHNKIKLTLYESLTVENTFKSLLNSFINPFKNNSTLENSNSKASNNELINFIIEFNNYNSSMISYSNKFCYYQSLNNLNNFGVKFLLVSFDLITYLQETLDEKNNATYFDYVISNAPFQYSSNLRLNKAHTKELNTFIKLVGMKGLFRENKQNMALPNESVVFRVNRTTNSLQEIDIKYEEKEFFHFRTKTSIFDKVPNGVFRNNFEKSKCVLDSKNILEIILEQLIQQ